MVCLPSDFWPPQKWVPQAERNVRRKRGVSSQIPQLQLLLRSSHEKNTKKSLRIKNCGKPFFRYSARFGALCELPKRHQSGPKEYDSTLLLFKTRKPFLPFESWGTAVTVAGGDGSSFSESWDSGVSVSSISMVNLQLWWYCKERNQYLI